MARKIPWPHPSCADPEDWIRAGLRFENNYVRQGLRAGLIAAMEPMRSREDIADLKDDREDRLMAAHLLQSLILEGEDELAWIVAEARCSGASWGEVARALGMTRQAAHKRFADKVASILASPTTQVHSDEINERHELFEFAHGNAGAAYRLGVLYEHRGESARAKQWYEKAVWYSVPGATEALDRLMATLNSRTV
jgi:hypothetical protein